MAAEKIIDYLYKNRKEIVNKVSLEDIAVHAFLSDQFRHTNVSKNYVFQIVFRVFYVLENVGLSKEIKNRYFKLMEENKGVLEFKDSDIKGIIRSLSKEKIYFSFATKLLNIISDKYPIYDSKVSALFGFNIPTHPIYEKRVEQYLVQYRKIKDFFEQQRNNKKIKVVISLFDKKFKKNEIHFVKKLDFILWAGGKYYLENKK